MAYFLPSYFQKRLLRYVLTRLDFIETDALNLENLDITLGQRSVIELKNVGIQVRKLVEQFKLPPSVVLNHASIRLLRITIPADLHISGIAVELDGIDIQVELQEDDNSLRRGFSSTPNHADVANRPRIASTSLHDPGGNRPSHRGHDDLQLVIPTSQDLAMSFLQSEPVEEREELEAAIQSQSHRISESTPSLDTSADESGIGMPGGFSLPGFVAKFFAGVADRLSISIRDVAASVTMKVNAENSSAETVKVMIKLAAVSMEGLHSFDDMPHQRSQRSLTIDGFEVFLMSEAEAFSRPSTTSSPKLTKSRSKMSFSSSDDGLRQFESPEQRMAVQEHLSQSKPVHRQGSQIEVSSDGSTSSSQLADLSVDLGDPLLANSSAFMPPTAGFSNDPTQRSLRESSGTSFIDNRKRAEDLLGSRVASLKVSRPAEAVVSSTDDLAESSLFTHDQAESMYMSAVSQAAGMPGGLGGSGNSQLEQSDQPTPHVPNQEMGINTNRAPFTQHLATSANPQSSESSRHAYHNVKETTQSRLVLSTSDLVAKQLIHVDRFIFSFPSSVSNERLDASDSQWPDANAGIDVSPPSKLAPPRERISTAFRVRTSEQTSSRLLASGHSRSSSKDFIVSAEYDYTLLMGTISINLDMAVSRMLIAAASQLQRNASSPPNSDKPNQASHASFTSSVTLDGVFINICQSVPEIPADEVRNRNYEDYDSIFFKTSCLLQLNLSMLRHELAMRPDAKRQSLVVEKIVLGHATQKYLYFVDTLGMRDSIAISQMIRPNDLVLTNLDDRFEIQIKPIHAVVDLLKVDDVLSRSGGLSSILDLGNSIMSTGTVTDVPPKPKQPLTRQRAVHFDNSSPRSRVESEVSGSGTKIDVRVSGAMIDLIGSESSVRVRTSAIKLVSRTGNFRAQIDNIVLAGPVLGRSQTRPGVNIKLSGLSLHFKDAPEEQDLERLLSLLTPSSDKYDDEDDIMVPTLLRQRRKGAVLGLNIHDIKVDVSGVAWLKHVAKLGDELSKLATVTKYLPEDDRPGVLMFGLVNKMGVNVDFGLPFGVLHLSFDLFEGALISVPSLMAAQINSISIKRGQDVLQEDVIPNSQEQTLMGPPMLMCRFIADEMEPTIRVKLSNVCFEYTVPTVIAISNLLEAFKSENSHAHEQTPSEHSSDLMASPNDKTEFARKVKVSLVFRDSAIGLNSNNSAARAVVLLSDSVFTHTTKKQASVMQLDLRKASILIIDDIAKLGHETTNADHKLYFEENDQVQELTKAGYVPVGSISNASAIINMTEDKVTNSPLIDVEFRNNLFLLETCADSTQTLIQVLSNLTPPTPPSPNAKYRTEVIPIQDMLASFTGNAFVSEPGPELGLQASQVSLSTTKSNEDSEEEGGDDDDDDDEDDDDDDAESEIGFNNMYHEDEDDHDRMTESYLESEISQSRLTGSLHVAPVYPTADPDMSMDQSIMVHSMLDFRTDHFVHKSSVGGTAHRWNSAQNTYGLGSETRAQESPLKIRVRDMHIIWNLFDGYDWQNTRDVISQAVKDIETKAMARKPRRRDSRLSPGDEDNESVIGDFLFNSIYIGIPANKDPRELANAITQDIGDLASDTGSYTTGTTVTASPSGRSMGTRGRPKKLRLNRSRQHKMTFELRGVSADVITFPSGSGEIENSVDVRVKMLEIFDHVPTSTWKKFATYMHEAGEREVDTNMLHLELLNVKPVAELSASEIVLKLTVLPLRLHVDQDALDFLTRFFEFKDERAPISTTPSTPPFIQRAEVNPIKLRLDFKPKRVDYGGLRSGRTTEFMNFFVLDRSDIILRRVILYGVSGLDRLGIMLNNIWTPDVKKNQLPTVLAGLAPIRPLVDVGSGVKDLIAVPIREYKKDGRIVRSIQKGAIAFAKTTTTELVNLGAKLAIGTQTVLQTAEEILVPRPQNDEDDGEKEQISLYADQPVGIVQGLRSAYANLERDLLLAKDAIVAVPGEVMASGSATGAAKAIIKQSPTIILRPAIGATKAVGQTLLGAGNTLDKRNLRRIEDKYKHR